MVDFTNPVEVVGRTIYGEARGTGMTGMHRVGNVIVDRARNPRWWGNTPLDVCLDPWQFSTWDARLPGQPEDANYLATINATTEDGWFAIAMHLAEQAIAGTLSDLTQNADSYYAIRIAAPSWTKRATHTMSDGWHSFWRVELGAPQSGLPKARNIGFSTPAAARVAPPDTIPDFGATA